MGHSISYYVRTFVAEYGYWAVAVALLCENAGIPVPGETTLLLASFLAYSEHRLQLPWIIVVATCAATVGDNLGYGIGFYGGRPLVDRYQGFFRISADAVKRGEAIFERYGSWTVFLARFVFGMRVIAGPLAGVLRMRWRTFTLFNFLGALTWVSVISSAGYLFGRHWRNVARAIRHFNIAFVAAVAVVLLFLWWRQRKGPFRRSE